MENILKFENVSFEYLENSPVLNDISFEIKKGSYTVILGHNGSGKSTLAKLAIGLLEANEGKIYVDNEELCENNLYSIRDKVAIVFQNPDNQFIGSTVEDDMAFGLENHNVPSNDMKDIIVKYATLVGMQYFLDKEPTELSGGQKQRVAIAGVLALNPSLLILDEATAMLDPVGRKEIFKVIKDLKNNNPDMSIISITHHIDEALQADEIMVINNGKVIKQGKPLDILYDKDLLINNNLVLPFVIDVKEKLKEKGINIDNVLSIDDLANNL